MTIEELIEAATAEVDSAEQERRTQAFREVIEEAQRTYRAEAERMAMKSEDLDRTCSL